jgi:hypothetical protein
MNHTNLLSAVLLASSFLANTAFAQAPQAITSASEIDSAILAKLEAGLAQTVGIDVQNQPLNAVLRDLGKQAKVSIRLSRKVEDAGIQPDQPVTVSLKELSLRSCLRNLLGNIGLTFLLKHEVITVTTAEDAASTENLLTKVYPVKDLVQPALNPTADSTFLDFDPLIEAITTSLEPDTWQRTGGSAAIDGHENPAVLVVSHRYDMHERVGALLTALRKAKTPQACAAETSAEAAARAKIEAALAKQVSYDFKDVPLQAVVDRLRTDSGIPIIVARKIEDAGVDLHTSINFEGDKVSLKAFLQGLLDHWNLTFCIKHEVLRITTAEDTQSPQNTLVRVYPVRDLIESPAARPGEPPHLDSTALGQLIMALMPDSWPEGTQFLTYHELTGCFVIDQTDEHHEQIVALLTTLRKAKALQDSSTTPVK